MKKTGYLNSNNIKVTQEKHVIRILPAHWIQDDQGILPLKMKKRLQDHKFVFS